jgi:HTH-type transcriptional regulator/antitoxin MqsA
MEKRTPHCKLSVVTCLSRSGDMKCPVCGAADLIRETRDLPYTYKGETTAIKAVTGDFCPACGESILDAAESERVMREMREFSKQVNAGLVDPGFIARVRKKLDLDQREAAEIFGGGINAFSRYETGKTKPPLALVKLLKVLDRHPDLLVEVRAA